MALCELKYFSPALGKATAANVILPERMQGPFPVLYLLHGLSDDHTIWQRRTNIERYLHQVPLIVVMPDGGRGFYCDALQGAAYETAIIRDLVEFIDGVFNTRTGRKGRALAGLSMGGYGAVKLALQHPAKFCCAVSHSGAMAFGHKSMPDEDPRADEFRRIVGKDAGGGLNDLFVLSQQVEAARRPALRIDCGTEDFLLEDNRDFHAHLKKIGYPHQYQEFPGGHTWDYWDEHVREAIEFCAHHLEVAAN